MLLQKAISPFLRLDITPLHVYMPQFLFIYIYFLLYFLFFNFTILYWFCHISTWIRHRYTCVPHPEPSSLLPPRTIPLGCPSAPAPSIQYRASNLDWRLVPYMILYVFQCQSSCSGVHEWDFFKCTCVYVCVCVCTHVLWSGVYSVAQNVVQIQIILMFACRLW